MNLNPKEVGVEHDDDEPKSLSCIFCKAAIFFPGLPAKRYKSHLCKYSLYGTKVVYEFGLSGNNAMNIEQCFPNSFGSLTIKVEIYSGGPQNYMADHIAQI